MHQDLRDAIENARSVDHPTKFWRGVESDRRHSRERIVSILKSIVRDLPDDLTIGELREELGE